MYIHTENLRSIYKGEERFGCFEFFIEGIDQLVKVVLPPNEFPNHMFLLNDEEKIKQALIALEIEPPPITIGDWNYMGVEIENGMYRPYLCELPIVHEIHPVMSEKINRTTAWFLREKEGYYVVEADPLRDIASGRAEEIKRRTLQELKKIQQFIFYSSSYQRRIPIGFYKGYAPILFFAKEIAFNEQCTPYTEVIVNGQSMRGKKLKTFSEFLYYMDQKNQKVENRIKIYDATLFGEKVPTFELKDTVRISSPKGDKASLKGLEGKIVFISGLNIGVTFFDYFHATFSPYELEKTES